MVSWFRCATVKANWSCQASMGGWGLCTRCGQGTEHNLSPWAAAPGLSGHSPKQMRGKRGCSCTSVPWMRAWRAAWGLVCRACRGSCPVPLPTSSRSPGAAVSSGQQTLQLHPMARSSCGGCRLFWTSYHPMQSHVKRLLILQWSSGSISRWELEKGPCNKAKQTSTPVNTKKAGTCLTAMRPCSGTN